MSSVELEDGKHEIIIVKRGHDEHDDHHGGVWKIAFADFMTAMMCFFLVMWLINAANEQTKAAVASYFNPVKLIDRNSSRKGLEDVGNGPQESGLTTQNPKEANGTAGTEGGANTANPTAEVADQADVAPRSDEHLFADPYAVLAEIATDTSIRQNISDKGDGGAQLSGPGTGASGGESYRDPFAPDFWTQQVAVPNAAEASAERSAGERMAEEFEKIEAELQKPASTTETGAETTAEADAEQTAEVKPGEDVPPSTEPRSETPEAAQATETDAKAQAEAKPEETEAAPKPDEEAPTAETVEAAAEIRQEIEKAFDPQDKALEGITVVPTGKGVVVSVTDQLDFGMYEIGSAVPRRGLVLAMEKIGKTLAARGGTVSINGHTDARPFRSATYDNWRLSTARAHSAYYMLVRGGLDEKRILEVAGFADRKLKDPANPFSATNRRIEILLEIAP